MTFVSWNADGNSEGWDRDPDAVQEAVRRQDEFVLAAIVERGGCVFKW